MTKVEAAVRRVIGAMVSIAVLAGSLGSAGAGGTVATISVAATATERAVRISGRRDVITIFGKTNAIAPAVSDRAIAAASSVGGAWAFGRGASVGLRSLRRGSAVLKSAPADWQVPMSVTVLPIDALGPVMSNDVAGVVAGGQIVIGAMSAALIGAAAGDVVDLVAGDAGLRSYTIGMVADDATVGGAELVVSPAIADQLGVVVETRIVLWGFPTRVEIDAAMAAQGLTTRSDTRIRRSWAPVDPDGTLGLGATKRLLGEFAYGMSSSDTVSQSSDWTAAFLPTGREVLLPAIPIRARCNLQIRADLTAALDEVYRAGLADAIDVGNANSYGGCYNPRFNRLSAALGWLSRHAWGGALDTNTVTNAQGAIPKMNCDVVRIFRKHNFAWGGNFLTPDGMHFEWVGAPRDQYQYPSAFCPNLAVAGGAETSPGTRPQSPGATSGPGRADASRDTLFADDGWGGGE